MVGPSGFEPETFCTPSKRATRLRYGPTVLKTRILYHNLLQSGIGGAILFGG